MYLLLAVITVFEQTHLGVVVHAFNTRALETESEGPQVQGPSEVCGEILP